MIRVRTEYCNDRGCRHSVSDHRRMAARRAHSLRWQGRALRHVESIMTAAALVDALKEQP